VENQAGSSGTQEKRKLVAHCACSLRVGGRAGPDRVTVADIADAANVSVRTFFNYYPSKESAIVASIRCSSKRPASASWPAGLRVPFDALRHVFTPDENTDVSDLATPRPPVRPRLAHPA